MEQTFNALLCILIFSGFMLFLSGAYALWEAALYGLEWIRSNGQARLRSWAEAKEKTPHPAATGQGVR